MANASAWKSSLGEPPVDQEEPEEQNASENSLQREPQQNQIEHQWEQDTEVEADSEFDQRRENESANVTGDSSQRTREMLGPEGAGCHDPFHAHFLNPSS
ncbi:hypothetical protein FKP32DRAFT_1673380 [Trametes sanguinea]|nr:hypothetical protein FKP32DRAFT_1673380 [Trametes sanguinea]